MTNTKTKLPLELAEKIGKTPNYMRKLNRGTAPLGPKLALEIYDAMEGQQRLTDFFNPPAWLARICQILASEEETILSESSESRS